MTIVVGQPAWIHDMNARPGHWREATVKSIGRKYITTAAQYGTEERFELTDTWRPGAHRAAPNSAPGVNYACFSEQAHIDHKMMENHHHKIVRAVDMCYDPVKLRQIMDLLGLSF